MSKAPRDTKELCEKYREIYKQKNNQTKKTAHESKSIILAQPLPSFRVSLISKIKQKYHYFHSALPTNSTHHQYWTIPTIHFFSLTPTTQLSFLSPFIIFSFSVSPLFSLFSLLLSLLFSPFSLFIPPFSPAVHRIYLLQLFSWVPTDFARRQHKSQIMHIPNLIRSTSPIIPLVGAAW